MIVNDRTIMKICRSEFDERRWYGRPRRKWHEMVNARVRKREGKADDEKRINE